jgi:hypothetical protein
MLVVSSTDGYCSIVTFAVGELGVVYEPRKETPSKERAGEDTAGIEPHEGSGSCKDTARVVLSDGTDKTEDSLATQEPQSNDTTVQSCASENMLDNHKTSEQLPKPTAFEEADVNSGSEENSVYTHIPDLQKTENIGTNSCGISESVPKQERTPRRIKPILLSSPRKLLARSLDSTEVSERKRELSSVMTPKKVCSTMTAAHTESLDSESNEVTKLGDISDVVVSERISPSFSHCSSCEKKICESYSRCGDSSDGTRLLPATDKMIINDIPSHNLTKEISGDTSGRIDTVKSSDTKNRAASCDPMDTETDSVTHKIEDGAISSNQLEGIQMSGKRSLSAEGGCALKCESMETNASATSPASPLPYSAAMPGQDKRTPRRVQLVTLSSPKSRNKLL